MSECLENEFANKQLSIYYRYATQAIFQKISGTKLRAKRDKNTVRAAFTNHCSPVLI